MRASVRSQISKLEENTKKAGKKSPELLKQSIAALNDKVKEAEQVKSEKLRSVLLIERKKYCNFLTMWGPVVNAQIDVYNEIARFKENQSYWTNLAASYLQLPNDVENMIKTQERTYPIHVDDLLCTDWLLFKGVKRIIHTLIHGTLVMIPLAMAIPTITIVMIITILVLVAMEHIINNKPPPPTLWEHVPPSTTLQESKQKIFHFMQVM